MFLNLSNHPTAQWETAQIAAALALAATIEDLPFPAVPADAGEAEIDRLADEYARRIPSGVSHALVQGEFTLTLALVRHLQERGVVCLAAASERRTQTTTAGQKLSEFAFVRFRAYPLLTGPAS